MTRSLQSKAERIARARLMYEDMVPKKEIEKATGLSTSILKEVLKDIPSIRQRKGAIDTNKRFSKDDLKTMLERQASGETIASIARDYGITKQRLCKVLSAETMLRRFFNGDKKTGD